VVEHGLQHARAGAAAREQRAQHLAAILLDLGRRGRVGLGQVGRRGHGADLPPLLPHGRPAHLRGGARRPRLGRRRLLLLAGCSDS